jgi:hypothetical protein
MNLSELIGQKIIFFPKNKFAPQDEDGKYVAILRGVEAGGIWIEHPTLTGLVASSIGKKPEELTKDAVFFFPYSQITWVVSFSTRLDLKSLGL